MTRYQDKIYKMCHVLLQFALKVSCARIINGNYFRIILMLVQGR